MQHIGESETNIVSGPLLSLYDKIVQLHGPSIIINAISRPDTLTVRISSYWLEMLFIYLDSNNINTFK